MTPDPFPPGSVLLDSARAENGRSAAPQSLLFTRPHRLITAHRADEVEEALERLAAAAAQGKWAAGYLAYEAGYALHPVAKTGPASLDDAEAPLVWFGVYDAPEQLAQDDVARRLPGGAVGFEEPAFGLGRAAYRRRIERIKALIREGDVYQINLTAPVELRGAGEPAALYATLRARQPVPYGALLRPSETDWVLSLSPELFFRLDAGRLQSRPMKGTAPRGTTPDQDDALAAGLAADPKNRAENLMIVDLLRNDLAAVARPGSVEVPALFDTERHPTLTQMTSTVEADLADGASVADVLRSLFPCGSITGAPKRRAMQRIAELEDEPRGVYCGAIGYVGPGEEGGKAVFNVPIRTLALRGDAAGWTGTMGVGSGVVWDSDADAEYDECLLKARFLTGPPLRERAGDEERERISAAGDFALLETMRAEGGGVERLDGHLERLAAAAAFFEVPLDGAAIRQAVERAAAASRAPSRLRLTVGLDGTPHVQASPLAEQGPIRTVAVFPEPVDADDPFLRFKTTHRPFYRRALDWAAAHGVDEPLLIDGRGRVLESARANVWAERGGRFVTPALHGAGLAGVERAHRLATDPRAETGSLTAANLWEAEAVYLSNAVRGLFRVEIRRV